MIDVTEIFTEVPSDLGAGIQDIEYLLTVFNSSTNIPDHERRATMYVAQMIDSYHQWAQELNKYCKITVEPTMYNRDWVIVLTDGVDRWSWYIDHSVVPTTRITAFDDIKGYLQSKIVKLCFLACDQTNIAAVRTEMSGIKADLQDKFNKKIVWIYDTEILT